jgi:polygalacturonase
VFGTAIAPAMENITYSNCTVHGALAGIRIKFRPTQFGFVRNILFEDIRIYNPHACESACSYLLRTA